MARELFCGNVELFSDDFRKSFLPDTRLWAHGIPIRNVR